MSFLFLVSGGFCISSALFLWLCLARLERILQAGAQASERVSAVDVGDVGVLLFSHEVMSSDCLDVSKRAWDLMCFMRSHGV